MQVHSELSADLDHNHEKALNRLLKDCTDEQLISELARRKVDIQVSFDVHLHYEILNIQHSFIHQIQFTCVVYIRYATHPQL